MYFNKPMNVHIINSSLKQTASLIFLHGSGDSGTGISSWLSSLIAKDGFFLPHIKYIFPSAPIRPYLPFGGLPTAVWFDRKAISPSSEEVVDSVDEACQAVHEIILKEISAGISANRIIIGGFSMGGALTLHYAYRYLPSRHPAPTLAGAFALSSFLNFESAVYDAMDKCETKGDEATGTKGDGYMPLFQAHGEGDGLVRAEWGSKTRDELAKRGVEVEFKMYPDVGHELVESEVKHLKHWIARKLPPL